MKNGAISAASSAARRGLGSRGGNRLRSAAVILRITSFPSATWSLIVAKLLFALLLLAHLQSGLARLAPTSSGAY